MPSITFWRHRSVFVRRFSFLAYFTDIQPNVVDISLICDKSVTTQNLAFLSYWYRKKRLQMHF
jgi:hypothetical protein